MPTPKSPHPAILRALIHIASAALLGLALGAGVALLIDAPLTAGACIGGLVAFGMAARIAAIRVKTAPRRREKGPPR